MVICIPILDMLLVLSVYHDILYWYFRFRRFRRCFLIRVSSSSDVQRPSRQWFSWPPWPSYMCHTTHAAAFASPLVSFSFVELVLSNYKSTHFECFLRNSTHFGYVVPFDRLFSQPCLSCIALFYGILSTWASQYKRNEIITLLCRNSIKLWVCSNYPCCNKVLLHPEPYPDGSFISWALSV